MYFRLFDLTGLSFVPSLDETLEAAFSVLDTNMDMLFGHGLSPRNRSIGDSESSRIISV
jgi:hypothetical protein